MNFSPGKFGAQFLITDDSFQKKLETLVYTTRPGLRVWKANASGVVLETIMYKDVLSKNMTVTPLLGSISAGNNPSQLEQQFGPVLVYLKKYLVIYMDNYVFVIDPENHSIMGSFQSAHLILDICVTGDEIFVLLEKSSVIRLATEPDCFGHPGKLLYTYRYECSFILCS